MDRYFQRWIEYYLNAPVPETLKPSSQYSNQSSSPTLDYFAEKYELDENMPVFVF